MSKRGREQERVENGEGREMADACPRGGGGEREREKEKEGQKRGERGIQVIL